MSSGVGSNGTGPTNSGITPIDITGPAPINSTTTKPLKGGKTSDVGGLRITSGVKKKLGSSSMPLDEDAQIALQQAAQARQAYQSQLHLQKQATLQAYTNQMEDLTKQHPLDEASLNSNYGSRGLGFSSGYGNANSQLQDVYDTNTDRLTQAYTDARNQYRDEHQSYVNAYNLNKAAIRQAAADRLSQLAGTLGLGTPTGNSGKLNNNLNGNV